MPIARDPPTRLPRRARHGHGRPGASALRAIEQLNARVLGKPKETIEQTVKQPRTLEKLDQLDADELAAEIERLERELGSL